MAAELITPLDEATNIPLPIMPRPDLPPVPGGRQKNLERVADWHHPFHPRALLTSEGIGAVAVRNCRVQWAEYDDHHHKYHGTFLGPALPDGEDEQFRVAVLAAAGYVPRRAIAFDGPRPYIQELSEEKREQLWHTRQLKVGNTAAVRDFLIAYALRLDFSGINNSTIDEFLHTPDETRRNELGGTFLAIAAYEAASPVSGLYKESRKLRLIPPEGARTAGRFIFNAMTTYKRSRALGALTSKLNAA